LGRFKISKGRAIDLQKWALKQSEAERFLDSLPKITKAGNAKPGLYVDYKIDENELDDSLDWPDVGIAAVYAVLEYSKEKIHLGEIRAYNFETFWLSTQEYDEVDTAENWFRLIKDDYKKLAKSGREDKEAKQINKESPRLVHDLMSFKLTGEEAEAIYRIIKEYEALLAYGGHIHCFAYESLQERPQEIVRGFLQYLGAVSDDEIVEQMIKEAAFEKVSGLVNSQI